jgi:hypothetical protein
MTKKEIFRYVEEDGDNRLDVGFGNLFTVIHIYNGSSEATFILDKGGVDKLTNTLIGIRDNYDELVMEDM